MTELLGKVRNVGEPLFLEFQQNVRLRRMAWLIVYLILFYLISFLHDSNVQSRKMNANIADRLTRLESTETIDVWKRRLEYETTFFESLRSTCWDATTPELASADMQTVIRQLAVTYGLKSVRLNLAEAEPYLLAGRRSWLIRAQLDARVERGGIPPLVSALESEQSMFAIERLHFVQGRGGSLSLLLAACFREAE
ncbi:MAG: hypothetical protein JJ934_16690 [Pseudomonadales bacterium]|nr:hypothetical protein [Pseudomonadales bacterium]